MSVLFLYVCDNAWDWALKCCLLWKNSDDVVVISDVVLRFPFDLMLSVSRLLNVNVSTRLK